FSKSQSKEYRVPPLAKWQLSIDKNQERTDVTGKNERDGSGGDSPEAAVIPKTGRLFRAGNPGLGV
ncbi:MAG: hypothetical protein WAV08_16135, partial [Desulfobacterales bacterium]